MIWEINIMPAFSDGDSLTFGELKSGGMKDKHAVAM